MKHLIFLTLLLNPFLLFAQGSAVLPDKPFQVDKATDTAVLGNLERQKGFTSLPVTSKESFYWTNVLRNDPKTFHQRYLIPFLEQFPQLKGPEAKALATRLQTVGRLAPLTFSSLLQQTADDHARYLAKQGFISHTGRGGKSFADRMAAAGVRTCAGENVFDGKDEALMALILLLIDKGVPGAGHREALLHPNFRLAGMGTSYMSGGQTVLVQQFACQQ